MGFISQARRSANHPLMKAGVRAVGMDHWAAKLRGPDSSRKPPKMGASLSIANNESAYVKLLQIMRSSAPGPPSDDRHEQTLRHFHGIAYVAIHRISQQLGRAEFQVFREDPDHPDGKRPVRHDEDAYDLVRLLKKPNRHDTFGKLMYRWSQQRRLTGSALTWLVPNKLGRPYEMYSIPTALAPAQGVPNEMYPEGYYRIQPIYPYGPYSIYGGPTSSAGCAIDARWMMAFRYPHPYLRYDGFSPLTGMRAHIDAIEMIDKTRHYLMRKGIYPNAVLNSTDAEGAAEMDDDDIARVRAMFEEEHMGPENAGRLLLAYAGWKLEKWGDPPSEMAFEAGWDQLSSFILGGGFGITKPAAGMVEDSSYQTLFATMKQLHLVTLEPECEDIGAELTRTVAPYFGDDLIVEVRVPRIDDHEIKFSKLNIGISGKCMTKNELRKELGLSLTKEPWGDSFAGEMEQPEQPMGAPGAAPGGDPMAALMGAAGGAPGGDQQPAPTPGSLSAGSLGPQPGTPPGEGQIAKPIRKRDLPAMGAKPIRKRDLVGSNGNGRH